MIENLIQPAAKRNGTEPIMLTRRSALLGLSASAIFVTAEETLAEARPTREDLEDYFLFLWAEHRRVAEELGIEVFDHETFRRRGGRDRYERGCSAPAASRALDVLALTGLAGGAE